MRKMDLPLITRQNEIFFKNTTMMNTMESVLAIFVNKTMILKCPYMRYAWLMIFLNIVLNIKMITCQCVEGAYNCSICYNDTACSSCQLGFRLNQTTMTCQKCNTGIARCMTGVNYFQQILPGYAYMNPNIRRCAIEGCKKCDTDLNICDQCQDRHMSLISSISQPCLPCDFSLFPGCRECQQIPQNGCISCLDGFYLDMTTKNCSPIGIYKCKVGSVRNCIQCLQGYYFQSPTSCQPCLSKACVKCDTGPQICSKCQVLFGVSIIAFGNQTCQRCTDAKCANCSFDKNNCAQCLSLYNIGRASTGTCERCKDSNCAACHIDNQICTYCKSHYGFLSQQNQTCVLCVDKQCQNCWQNYRICFICNTNFGLKIDIVPPFSERTCVPCIPNNLSCLICQPTNFFICKACILTHYLSGDKKCLQCQKYRYCATCFESSSQIVQCTSCKIYKSRDPVVCQEICGDLMTIDAEECDNQVGILYDGCTDQCKVEENFDCFQINASICSFNGTFDFIFINALTDKSQPNRFSLEVQIRPPIHILSQTPNYVLIQIFILDCPALQVQQVMYNPIIKSLLFIGNVLADVEPGTEIPILFQPNYTTIIGYKKSVPQNGSIIIQKWIYFQSQDLIRIGNAIMYMCYATSALVWVAVILGVILRRLSGLEAIFVVQIAYLSFVCLSSGLLPIFTKTSPLKYSTTYSHQFVKESSDIQIQQSPNLISFNLSKDLLVNNFNLFLILEIVVVIAIIITQKRKRNILSQQNELWKKNKKSIKIYQKQLDKLIDHNQFCYQLLLTLCLSNLVYFTAVCSFYFKYSHNIANPPSLVIFCLQILLTFGIITKFLIDPVVFSYFRFSFKFDGLSMSHYYFYIVMLISTAGLLTTLNRACWACLLPVGLMLLYTIAKRPYKDFLQNLRSIFNLLTIISLLFYQVFLQYFCSQTELKSIKLLAYFYLNMLLLPVVIIISIISIIYYYYYYEYKFPGQAEATKNAKRKQIEKMREKLLQELVQINPNQNISHMKKQTIFKKIVSGRQNLLNVSNELQQIQEHMYQNQREAFKEIKKNKPLLNLNIQEGSNQQYKICRSMVQMQKINNKFSPQKKTFNIAFNNHLQKLQNQREQFELSQIQYKVQPQTTVKPNEDCNQNKQEKEALNEQTEIKVAKNIVITENTFINLEAAVDKIQADIKHVKEFGDQNDILEYNKIDASYVIK